MSRLAQVYEQLRPLIVWLGLTELAWIASWLLRADDGPPGFRAMVAAWIVAMLLWLGLVAYAGMRGFFLAHTRWLSNLVGVAIVVTFAGLLFGALPFAQDGLLNAAAAVSDGELILIHALRLLAVGTIVKYVQRELPLHFVVFGAIPDLLFAASAVVLLLLSGPPGREFLIVWHAVGLSVFLGAGVSMFFSVPSPLRLYDDQPDTSLVFSFPMLLAPNFTVPLFMLAHAFALVKLVL